MTDIIAVISMLEQCSYMQVFEKAYRAKYGYLSRSQVSQDHDYYIKEGWIPAYIRNYYAQTRTGTS